MAADRELLAHFDRMSGDVGVLFARLIERVEVQCAQGEELKELLREQTEEIRAWRQEWRQAASEPAPVRVLAVGLPAAPRRARTDGGAALYVLTDEDPAVDGTDQADGAT